jgi:hypothetical protein
MRVKTLKEFKSQYGSDWRRKVPCYFSEGMDYLLGQKIPNKKKRQMLRSQRCTIRNHYRSFTLSRQMVRNK